MMGRDFRQRIPEQAQPFSVQIPQHVASPHSSPARRAGQKSPVCPTLTEFQEGLKVLRTSPPLILTGICALFNREGSERLYNFPRSHSQIQEIHNQHIKRSGDAVFYTPSTDY